ncbi:MAG: diacylglycerol kinase family lipid kinase [Gemmatimonadetes bacterium]|jgi:diacylglycerol kinase (ATP)|nr:diacylglycerol kinase family lipid kinase [Gemmatimonadota bacterium]MBT6149185.1 diacylglycerol kinase family lipid kinase [Gemmatimonadota bacterium]MBT7859899.1 diacylglycerol kinase family lipid kinase [Gemmatimonadota bacterium]
MSCTWALIANPSAGCGRPRRLVEACVAGLQSTGLGVDLSWSTGPGHATRLANEAVESGTSGIIIAGGDGTISEVLQAPLPPDLPIGLLPCGSGNDLARSLGIARGRRAIDVILAGHGRQLDLGQCGHRRFATVAACGLDAAVSEAKLTGHAALPGTAGYVWATLRTLARHQPTRLRMTGDFGTIQMSTWLVATANTSCYGGGVRIAPNAQPNDGLFDVVIVDGALSHSAALTLLPRTLFGRHLPHPAIRVERTPWLQIEPIDSDQQILHADGERLGHAPATLCMQPGALRILTPRPADR